MLVALILIASAVTFALFYRQSVESMLGSGLYRSDMKAYILEMQGQDSGYSFPYPILFKLAALIHLVTASMNNGAELAMALATLLLNSGAMVCLKVMLDKHVGAKKPARKRVACGSADRNSGSVTIFRIHGLSTHGHLSAGDQI